jgi:hypothetical protein
MVRKAALLPLPPEVLLGLLFLREVTPARQGERLTVEVHLEVLLGDAGGLEPDHVLLVGLGEVEAGRPHRLEHGRGRAEDAAAEHPVEDALEVVLDGGNLRGCYLGDLHMPS